MNTNPDKCHFLSSLDVNTKISVSSFDMENTHSQKLLDFTIDRKLIFHDHVSSQCKKASAKICTLMLLNETKLIMKAILMSQFGYCPLVWINQNKTLNNWINSLHERVPQLVYNNFKASFHQLLEKDNSVTIYQRKLEILGTVKP